MLTINAKNVSDALTQGLELMQDPALVECSESRNGPVIEFTQPVATTYRRPLERVLLCPVRDANPFFHIAEAAWMLAGRADVAPLARILPSIANYSDDGVTFHGAYGARIMEQIKLLRPRFATDPNTRRVVVSIWDTDRDGTYYGKDLPCNNLLYFWARHGVLHLTVCCRSNDMVWGAYGANAVQFSYFLEYAAALLGFEVGTYTQVSNNLHLYVKEPAAQRLLEAHHGLKRPDPYLQCATWDKVPLCRDPAVLLQEARLAMGILEPWRQPWAEPWIAGVLVPALQAHAAYREGRFLVAHALSKHIAATDWRLACQQWVERRAAAKGLDIATLPS